MALARCLRLWVGRSLLLALAASVVVVLPSAAVGSAQVSAPPTCLHEVDAIFWGGAQPFPLGQALAANPSPCAEYWVTLPPPGADRTMLALRARFDEIRALGIHPVAEIRWTSPTGWRAWVVDVPGRTFYEGGVTARRRMAQRGLDVEAGETWAFNELTPEVLAGEPGARAEVLEFLRGLYDGDPGMPKARGIVFNIWVPSTTGEPEVEAYKARLQAWLADEQFWTELDPYVDVFAHEVYVSALNWGVSGAPVAKRAKRMNDYFQHLAVLADDAPKEFHAARSFLRRTYLPLANAAWPHPGIGDTHLLSADEMRHFVSTQVYALRQFALAHPKIVPQGLLGFGWAPVSTLPGYTPEGRDQIAARLAGAIRDATGEIPSTFKDACGLPGERVWCEGAVDGAEFNPAWRIFDGWD